ncbi:MAG: hypothetical protein AAF658_07115, partial [Myxococcota bacterium]
DDLWIADGTGGLLVAENGSNPTALPAVLRAGSTINEVVFAFGHAVGRADVRGLAVLNRDGTDRLIDIGLRVRGLARSSSALVAQGDDGFAILNTADLDGASAVTQTPVEDLRAVAAAGEWIFAAAGDEILVFGIDGTLQGMLTTSPELSGLEAHMIDNTLFVAAYDSGAGIQVFSGPSALDLTEVLRDTSATSAVGPAALGLLISSPLGSVREVTRDGDVSQRFSFNDVVRDLLELDGVLIAASRDGVLAWAAGMDAPVRTGPRGFLESLAIEDERLALAAVENGVFVIETSTIGNAVAAAR